MKTLCGSQTGENVRNQDNKTGSTVVGRGPNNNIEG